MENAVYFRSRKESSRRFIQKEAQAIEVYLDDNALRICRDFLNEFFTSIPEDSGRPAKTSIIKMKRYVFRGFLVEFSSQEEIYRRVYEEQVLSRIPVQFMLKVSYRDADSGYDLVPALVPERMLGKIVSESRRYYESVLERDIFS